MDIIRSLLYRIRNSEIIKNIFFLLSSNGLAQLFPFLIYPFISRLYSPDAFGQLAIIVSIHGLIASVATGKYDQAITLPKNDLQALHLFNIGLRISAGISLLLIPVVFLVQHISNSCNFGIRINYWFYLLALTVFSTTYLQLVNGWSLRFKLFKIIAGSTIVLSAVTAVLKLVFGVLNIGDGLLYSFVGAQVLTALYITFRIRRSSSPLSLNFTGKELTNTAISYSNFPKYYMINALLNTFSSNLPIYTFAFYFSDDIIGQFSVALTLLFTPIGTFNTSVNQVLMKRAIEMKHSDQPVWPFIKKYITRTLLFSIGPGLILILLIPYIINIYLGSHWTDTGRFCQFMIPYAIGVLVSGSLGFIPNVFDKQLQALLIYIVYLVFRIGALGIGILFKDVYIAVGLYALVSLLAVTYQVFWYRKVIIASDKSQKVHI